MLAIGTNRTAGCIFMSRMHVIYAVHCAFLQREHNISNSKNVIVNILAHMIFQWILFGFEFLCSRSLNASCELISLQFICSNDKFICEYFILRLELTWLYSSKSVFSVQCSALNTTFSCSIKTSFSHFSCSSYQFW